MSRFDLPRPLPEYFKAVDKRVTLPLFSEDAVVDDEGSTHRGHPAIGSWIERVESSYQPRYRLLDVAAESGRTLVTLEVSGTFPNSPITLRQAFTLVDGRIQQLQTL